MDKLAIAPIGSNRQFLPVFWPALNLFGTNAMDLVDFGRGALITQDMPIHFLARPYAMRDICYGRTVQIGKFTVYTWGDSTYYLCPNYRMKRPILYYTMPIALLSTPNVSHMF